MFSTPTTNAAFTRSIGVSLTGVNTGFALLFNPNSLVIPSSGFIGSGATGYLKGGQFLDGNNNLSLNSPFVLSGAANLANIQSTVDQFTPVTAALRVTVRYPMSSAPGRLFAMTISDNESAFATSSPNTLLLNDNARPLAFDGGGVAAIQANWRPSGENDFRTQATNTNILLTTRNTYCVIIGVGWPPLTPIDIETIAHIEGLAGIDLAAGSDTLPQSLSMSVSKERLAVIARTVPMTLTHSEIQLCQRAALRPSLDAFNRHGVGRNAIAAEIVSEESTGPGSYATQVLQEAVETGRGYMPSAENIGRMVGTAAASLAAAGVQRHRIMA